MVQKIISIIFLSVLLVTNSKLVLAYDNLEWTKNKFGIHVSSNTQDLTRAKELLNNNGGDWGWVTTVIRNDELNYQQWQDFFNHCRRYHLVPIVRLATIVDGQNWRRPDQGEIEKMANFLNSLNWPSLQKFVIVYNEPNRSNEWGSQIDAKNYFEILEFTADYFHNLDQSFFILSAGLDLAAPQAPPSFVSPENFYHQGFLYKPEALEKIDGLASHSYPNHGFVGTPYNEGKTSIKGYNWEISYLKQLGLKKDLPVFITETGWPHQEGEENNKSFYSADKGNDFLKSAIDIWLSDPKVIGFTPFILNYPYPPFDHFSWLNKEGEPYPQFESVKSLEKTSQQPEQIERVSLVKISFPFLLKKDKEYQGKITIKNNGQSIWGERGEFCLNPLGGRSNLIQTDKLCLEDGQLIEPGQEITLPFSLIPSGTDEIMQFGWEQTPEFEIRKLPQVFPGKIVYRRKTGVANLLTNFLYWILSKIDI